MCAGCACGRVGVHVYVDLSVAGATIILVVAVLLSSRETAVPLNIMIANTTKEKNLKV